MKINDIHGHAAPRAVQASSEGGHQQAVQLRRPVRNIAPRPGGDQAQRDPIDPIDLFDLIELIDLTLIEAAQRGGPSAPARALHHHEPLDARAG